MKRYKCYYPVFVEAIVEAENEAEASEKFDKIFEDVEVKLIGNIKDRIELVWGDMGEPEELKEN